MIEKYFNGEMYQEMYNAIKYFLLSFEIREGKFEGNEILITKLNREDVIVYKEYILKDGTTEYSAEALILKIPDLIHILKKMAVHKGLEE